MAKEYVTKPQRSFIDEFKHAIDKIEEGGQKERADTYKPVYEALCDGNSVLALIIAKFNNLPESYQTKIAKLWRVGKIE